MKVEGIIKSNEGFYIGDLCYALNDGLYHGIWGEAGYQDGIYEEPVTGFKFAVAGTAYGDGTYTDDMLNEYGVDAGNISLVPNELAEDIEDGHYFPGAGEAKFEAEDGYFKITLPDGNEVHINTKDDEYEEDEDDYYENEWGEEDYWEDEEYND